jgi:hypothetical protein
MNKQIDQQQETHGITTNHINNQDKTQTHHTTLLRLKAGYVQHTSPTLDSKITLFRDEEAK